MKLVVTLAVAVGVAVAAASAAEAQTGVPLAGVDGAAVLNALA